MKTNQKIIAIYASVAVLSVAMILIFRSVGAAMPDAQMPQIRDVGREVPTKFFQIENDLELVNQAGEEVKLSDIEGGVTVLAQFFAVCPHCAVRNGMELVEIYKKFGDHPDFRIVCITVDPETDDQEQLASYGEVLGADPENWWFATAGDQAETHAYLEQELKFFKIRERTDPVDIGTHGKFAHDLGFLLVDREMNVIGKWPLADARSEEAEARDPGIYERLKTEMYDRIQAELDKS